MTHEVVQEFFAEIDVDDDCCLVTEEVTTMLQEVPELLYEEARKCLTTTRGWTIRKVFDMVDDDKTDCIDYPEAEWYYECAHKEHGWTIPLEKGYKDNNFD